MLLHAKGFRVFIWEITVHAFPRTTSGPKETLNKKKNCWINEYIPDDTHYGPAEDF